jgi:hypothetical protein
LKTKHRNISILPFLFFSHVPLISSNWKPSKSLNFGEMAFYGMEQGFMILKFNNPTHFFLSFLIVIPMGECQNGCNCPYIILVLSLCLFLDFFTTHMQNFDLFFFWSSLCDCAYCLLLWSTRIDFISKVVQKNNKIDIHDNWFLSFITKFMTMEWILKHAMYCRVISRFHCVSFMKKQMQQSKLSVL